MPLDSILLKVEELELSLGRILLKVDKLELYKTLTKLGAVWEGDIQSFQWSEYLAVRSDVRFEVEQALNERKAMEGTLFAREMAYEKLVGVWLT